MNNGLGMNVELDLNVQDSFLVFQLSRLEVAQEQTCQEQTKSTSGDAYNLALAIWTRVSCNASGNSFVFKSSRGC